MKNQGNVTVLALAAVAIAALAAVTAIVITAPEGADLTTLLTIVLTGTGTLLATILNLGRTEAVKGTVDDLANGKMDAKIRAAVADVLQDRLIDPAALDQITRDRVTRDH